MAAPSALLRTRMAMSPSLAPRERTSARESSTAWGWSEVKLTRTLPSCFSVVLTICPTLEYMPPNPTSAEAYLKNSLLVFTMARALLQLCFKSFTSALGNASPTSLPSRRQSESRQR